MQHTDPAWYSLGMAIFIFLVAQFVALVAGFQRLERRLTTIENVLGITDHSGSGGAIHRLDDHEARIRIIESGRAGGGRDAGGMRGQQNT